MIPLRDISLFVFTFSLAYILFVFVKITKNWSEDTENMIALVLLNFGLAFLFIYLTEL